MNYKYLLCALVFSVLNANLAFAEPIHRTLLTDGISLEIPPQWIVLSQEQRKNVPKLYKALSDKTGIEGESGRIAVLLVTSPKSLGANIRVTVQTPPNYSQNDLATITSEELNNATAMIRSNFDKLAAASGYKIIEMQPVRVEWINHHRAFVIQYVRSNRIGDTSPWLVTNYRIPIEKHTIYITFECKKSEDYIWRPLLERVKSTLQF